MIIGTRGSILALEQAKRVAFILKSKGVISTINIIKTKGDIKTKEPLYLISNGDGVFVNELDEALESLKIDIAVHSMKDLPSNRKDIFSISSVLKRDSPYDVLISNIDIDIENIPDNFIIGTSSLRRKAQLLRYNSNLVIKELRGNIDTRIKRLNENEYDAIILSEAGLERLNLIHKLKNKIMRLPIDKFCPAPNQGTIAVVAIKNSVYNRLLNSINDKYTFIETYIERKLMEYLNVGCFMPIGIYAKHNNNSIDVFIDIIKADGSDSFQLKDTISLNSIDKEIEKITEKIQTSKGMDIINSIIQK